MLQLWVKNAGIATSNVLFRRWEREGQHYHHIIDGHSLTCAHSDIVQVTVVAPTTAEADAAAKVICTLASHQVHECMRSQFPSLAYIVVKNTGELKISRQLCLYAEKVV